MTILITTEQVCSFNAVAACAIAPKHRFEKWKNNKQSIYLHLCILIARSRSTHMKHGRILLLLLCILCIHVPPDIS